MKGSDQPTSTQGPAADAAGDSVRFPRLAVALYDTDRVWTLPNVLSLLRLAGVPLMLWLILGPQADALAVLVLALGGFTDWLDGFLARRLAPALPARARCSTRSPTGSTSSPCCSASASARSSRGGWWSVLVARDVLIAPAGAGC